MKAIVYDRYGPPDVLRLVEVEKPVAAPGQVLVRVRGAAVNPYDWHFMRGKPYFLRLVSGLRAPKRDRLGVDFAGVVEAVGPEVTTVKVGDEVYGMQTGAFAQYLCAPESSVAPKPRMLDFSLAAAIPLAGLTALQGLRNSARLQAGERVLIIGASGGVGTFAVQIAEHLGARVTGVCSTGNLGLVASLGADHVIDYTREDFTATAEKFDVVFQLGGMDSPARCRRALTPRGRLVLCSGDSEGAWIGPLGRFMQAPLMSPFVKQKLMGLEAKRSREDLVELARLVDEGALRPIIDRSYPLAEAADAVRYVEVGHARGKVLVQID